MNTHSHSCKLRKYKSSTHNAGGCERAEIIVPRWTPCGSGPDHPHTPRCSCEILEAILKIPLGAWSNQIHFIMAAVWSAVSSSYFQYLSNLLKSFLHSNITAFLSASYLLVPIRTNSIRLKHTRLYNLEFDQITILDLKLLVSIYLHTSGLCSGIN